MASTSGQTPRILTRGETTQFRVSFFSDPALTNPLTPLTPDYPQYTIYNPEGTAIQTGTGIQVSPGIYRLDFLVPKDALLSYFNQKPQRYGDEGQGQPLTANDSRYRIEWMMVTRDNFQVNFVEEFDVQDIAITQSESRELKYLVLEGDPARLLFRTTAVPYFVTMRLVIRGDTENPVVTATFDSLDIPGSDIQSARDGDSYVLYYDVPANSLLGNTCYMALWQVTETAFSVPMTEYQIITAISPCLLPMMTSLRMLIDRFQKRLGRVYAYEDSDLLEYIARGLHLVNLQYPTTNFGPKTIPDPLSTYVLLAAGWYGLQAQSILEAEMGFDFSGQSVTLNLSGRSSAIDSAISRMREEFNSGLAAAKTAYVIGAGGVGTAAVRPYNFRAFQNFSYRVSSMGSDGFMSLFNKIGLL